jgi:hypothetical protein
VNDYMSCSSVSMGNDRIERNTERVPCSRPPCPVQQAATVNSCIEWTEDISSVSISQDLGKVPMSNAEGNALGIQYDASCDGVASSPGKKLSVAISKCNPTVSLKEYYDQCCEPRVTFAKDRFVTIEDKTAGHHVPVFTSLFVCPRKGEIFLSGRLFSHVDGVNQFIIRNNMAWYKTKADSQRAAAGRAMDCFHWRVKRKNQELFCDDYPYRTTDFSITPNDLEKHYHFPPSEIEKVQKLKRYVCGNGCK